MVSATLPSTPSTPSSTPATNTRWIFNPIVDLALGCGGLYALLFFAYPLVGEQLSRQPAQALVAFMVFMISLPHYGATLVRVYKDRSERRKYAVFSVYATIFLCAWFVLGVYDVLIASWMVTLYISWSPWHYSGQNYGISLMFLSRRGVTVTNTAKWALWLTFISSFLLAFLGMHQVATNIAPDFIVFKSLGLSPSVVTPIAMAVIVVYVVSLAVAGAQLLRTGSLRDIAPAALLVLTQSMWFALPFAFTFLNTSVGPLDASVHLLTATLWVAVAHSTQYLWITSYYANREASWHGVAPYYGSILLAGVSAWVVPAVLFAPYALGSAPFSVGLPILMAALVNLHHFVLDGAIWKLRSGRVASILIRSVKETEPASQEAGWGGRRWLLHAAMILAVVCVGARLLYVTDSTVTYPAAIAREDLDAASSALSRISFIGGDRAEQRTMLGKKYEKEQDYDAARSQYLRAVALNPHFVRAHTQLARLYSKEGEYENALREYQRAVEIDQRALEINPSDGRAKKRLGRNLRMEKSLERLVGTGAV